MSNVFARCTALGLFAGGFALTGDLGWMAERGMRVVNSRSIPAEEPAGAPPAAEPSAAAPESAVAAPPAPPQLPAGLGQNSLRSGSTGPAPTAAQYAIPEHVGGFRPDGR